VLVVEDDPYGLLRFEGERVPTLHELDGGDNVIYSSSFTKTVAPGIRTGYLVLPERLAGWGEKYPDVRVQRLVARGRAGRALLDEAARAQLAVVGSRGHGEIAGLLLDSVSNALVHGAGCPVAIVRSTR